MFMHNKRLQYTVQVNEPNPTLACAIMEQFGGADGELAAAMRYFTQALSEEDPGRKDLLMDISTEELSHLEIVGNIVGMLNKGVKARISEGMQSEAELLANITGGSNSQTEAILFGGGPALVNSSGVAWNASYVDTRGDPAVDLRSNIAAEARAKIVYERLLNITSDPGVRDALTFLMTREVAHQKSFEKALYAIDGNFPVGKIAPDPAFSSVYYNMSNGEDSVRGSWNQGQEWEYVEEPSPAVDGGSGMPTTTLDKDDATRLMAFAKRTASNPDVDPTTGAELGQKPTAGRTKQRPQASKHD